MGITDMTDWSRTRALFVFLLPAIAAAVFIDTIPADAAPLKNVPSMWIQPDGTPVPLSADGDEFHRRVYDADGFTVIPEPESGWLKYADTAEGRLVPTGLVAGVDDPMAAGLRPLVDESPDLIAKKASAGRSKRAFQLNTPSTGVVNNLFVFVRFTSDDILLESSADYERQFNGTGTSDASMRAYFNEVSRGALDIRTVFTPAPADGWMTAWTSSRTRDYYRPYDPVYNTIGYRSDSEAQQREHDLLKEALAAVEPSIPTDIDFDANDDGYYDNVIFMVQGWPDAWADLLWPHQWEFFEDVTAAGLKVRTYNLQLSVLMLISPGTFVHEMYHSIGAPDLYHYSQDGLDPVGPWCVMASTGLESAQHPLSYMKWKYGAWIDDIPVVSTNSDIVLHSSWESGTQAVLVPVAESESEYFVVEYRKRSGRFEPSLPASGVIVYRIDPSQEGIGNRNGPPDEVYVFRPGGTTESNGRLAEAVMKAGGRTVMNESTDPTPVLGDGSPVTFRVWGVGETGDSIGVRICLAPPGCGVRVCGDDGCGGFCGTCTEGNHCVEGACVPCSCIDRFCGDDGCGVSCGTCDDGDQCTADLCVDGTCSFERADGSPCDDGNPCTSNDTCDQDGGCVGTAYSCVTGQCEATSECDGKGTCTVTVVAEGTGCDDDDPCTADDGCNADGTCSGAPYACTPDACHIEGTCDGTGGCQWVPAPAGTSCDDGDPETNQDMCLTDGTCAGTPTSGDTGVVDNVDSHEPDTDAVVADDSGHVNTDNQSSGCSASNGTGSDGTVILVLLTLFGGLAVALRRKARISAHADHIC